MECHAGPERPVPAEATVIRRFSKRAIDDEMAAIAAARQEGAEAFEGAIISAARLVGFKAMVYFRGGGSSESAAYLKSIVRDAALAEGMADDAHLSALIDAGWQVGLSDCLAKNPELRERERSGPPTAIAHRVSATLYEWRPPAAIPLRPWVLGRWFLRGTVACVVAPGGVGKSTLMASIALSLASGQALLGQQVWERPQRVWLWNLEDDLDELSRSIQAAAQHHGLSPSDLADRLFVDSGMEGSPLCTATGDGKGFAILEPVYDALAVELTRKGIDVLIIDPFVSSHRVPENDNGMIDAVAKAWARVAKKANCVVVLVHHTSKAGAAEVSALSARGAVSLVNAARSALVLNRMTGEEGKKHSFGDAERRRYITISDDKHNRAPAQRASWYQLVPVDLGNGGIGFGDSVAVIEPWKRPDPFDGLTVHDLARVQETIATGEWREDIQAKAWAGHAVADVMGLNVGKPADKARIKALLRSWIVNGVLKIEIRNDKKSEPRKWIVVGDPVEASPRPNLEVRTGEEG